MRGGLLYKGGFYSDLIFQLNGLAKSLQATSVTEIDFFLSRLCRTNFHPWIWGFIKGTSVCFLRPASCLQREVLHCDPLRCLLRSAAHPHAHRDTTQDRPGVLHWQSFKPHVHMICELGMPRRSIWKGGKAADLVQMLQVMQLKCPHDGRRKDVKSFVRSSGLSYSAVIPVWPAVYFLCACLLSKCMLFNSI